MDTAIVFTPAQFFSFILAVSGWIVSVAAAAAVIGKVIQAAKKPNDEQNKRLDALEKRLKEHDERFDIYKGYLSNDRGRLDNIEDGNRVTQQAILALLAHAIDGNNIEPLKDAKEALQQYLINR